MKKKSSQLNIVIIILSIVVVGLIAYFLLFSDGPSIESISFTKKSINILVGESIQVDITVLPENAGKKVMFESENIGVASVSEEGIIKGESAGSTTIIARNKNGSISDTCRVNVIKNKISAITFNNDTVDIFIGESSKLDVKVEPAGLRNYNLNWSSSDPSIVDVDEHGNITGLKNGEAIITASSGNIESECTVRVITIVESVSLSENRITVDVEETNELIATIKPSDATNKNVIWESSDPTIATVDSNGVVTGVKAGSAVVTVKTLDGNKEAICNVTVIYIPRYTIKYVDLNQTIIKKEGQTLGTLPLPKKEGYIFKGWFTDSKKGTQVNENTKVTKNMTLYAHWEEEETFTEGPGQGIYSRTVTYMGRTFKDYKQNRMGAAIEARGCGPVSLYSILSGYNDNITINQIINITGLSTDIHRINSAARNFGLSHSKLYVYSSRNPNTTTLRILTETAISELKKGHQLIVLVTRSSMCTNGICNGLPYDAYSWGNHFIAIVGLKKDGEHVIILNPMESRMEEGRMEDIIKYYLPGGPNSGFVSYWK